MGKLQRKRIFSISNIFLLSLISQWLVSVAFWRGFNAIFMFAQCQCCFLNCTVTQANECRGDTASFCKPSVAEGLCVLDATFTPRWCNFSALDDNLVGNSGKLSGKDSKGNNCNSGSRDCSCLRNGTSEATFCVLGLQCQADTDGKMRCLPSDTPIAWSSNGGGSVAIALAVGAIAAVIASV